MRIFINIALLLLLFSFSSTSQNLITNGGFEQYTFCPDQGGQIDQAAPWFNPTIGLPSGGSPDYFNTCATHNFWLIPSNFYGHQQAHSGDAYVGLLLYNVIPANTREYIEIQLSNQLVPGNVYHFEMYFNLANICARNTDALQVYFSDTAITGFQTWDPLPFTPQLSNTTGNMADSLNWTLFSGDYTAQGGENFITIGNFLNDSSTTVISNPFVGSLAYAYIYVDDISLTMVTGINENDDLEVSSYPNPVTSTFNVVSNKKSASELIIYDLSSRIIAKMTFISKTTYNTEGLSKGMYLYTVTSKDGVVRNGSFVKE